MRELDQFLKTLPNGNEVFDYEAIMNEDYPITVIISERGVKGKTYGLKEFIFNQTLTKPNKNIECLFLRSLVQNADEEGKRFLVDVPDNMANAMDELVYEKNKVYYKKKPTFVFKPVSTTSSLRGSRQIFNYIVWDEFNDSIRYFHQNLVNNFANILSSADNPQERVDGKNPRRIILLGNNRGLNHPLLINLGVDAIQGEVTRINAPNGLKMVLLICPIYNETDKQQIEDKNKNDWLFQMNKMLGTADHIYFNQSDVDKINYIYHYVDLNHKDNLAKYIRRVLDPMIEINNRLELKYTFLIDGNYINMYWIPEKLRSDLKTTWHIINVDLLVNRVNRTLKTLNTDEFLSRDIDGNLLIYTTNKLEITESVRLLQSQAKNNMILLNADCKFSFENMASRASFMNLIKR